MLGYLLYDGGNSTPTPGGGVGSASDATCRVCYSGREAGRLFSPCLCSGTMAYVHVRCLNEWRAASVNPRSFYTCDACGYNYRTQRSVIAEALNDERCVWAGSSVLLALLVAIGWAVPGHAERYIYAFTAWQPRAEFSWWGDRCDHLIAGLLLPGVLGFGHVVYKRLARGADNADAILGLLGIMHFITVGGVSPELLLICLVYLWANLAGALQGGGISHISCPPPARHSRWRHPYRSRHCSSCCTSFNVVKLLSTVCSHCIAGVSKKLMMRFGEIVLEVGR